MSTESVTLSNHLILCRPLLLMFSILPSIKVFSSESIMWPKYWSFSFCVSASNEYSGLISFKMGFPCGSGGKESTCNAGDLGSIPGLGRSPGEGKGYPPQHSGLENSKDYIVHGVSKSQTQLSDLHCHFLLGLTRLITLQSKGFSRVCSSATVRKHQFFSVQPSLWSNSHLCTWLLEKPQRWLHGPLSTKWCLCFLIHRLGLPQLFFFYFHGSSQHPEWFWSPGKCSHCLHFLPFYLPWSDGTRYHDLSFLNVEF